MYRWLLHSWCEVAVSSGQKARMGECTVPSRPASTGWEWQEIDAGTKVKWSRRRIQLLEIRGSVSGGNRVETEPCIFRKFEHRRATSGAVRVLMWCVQLQRCTDYKLSCCLWTHWSLRKWRNENDRPRCNFFFKVWKYNDNTPVTLDPRDQGHQNVVWRYIAEWRL